MIRFLLLILLFCVSGAPPMAQELRNPVPTPEDFSWQWPLALDATQDMMRFTLSPEVYPHLWRDDLADVVVFNAAGESVPLAPLESVLQQAGRLKNETRAMPDKGVSIYDIWRLFFVACFSLYFFNRFRSRPHIPL